MQKILIAGIGGVGGYFGGLLALKYRENPEVEINFLARGAHLDLIKQNGLKVIEGNTEFIAHPHLASNDAKDFGPMDLIILCTKSYDLDNTLIQLKPCITPETVFLPLLNGVESADQIKQMYPNNRVYKGCVYIVAQIKEPGMIENMGNIKLLFFGSESEENSGLIVLEDLFKSAGIEATLEPNMDAKLWEKFYFVGSNSTATSYFNASTGTILEDANMRNFLVGLLAEINSIAAAKGIKYSQDMAQNTLEKLMKLPYATTSSLQRDFQKPHAKNELETITGYVVRAGEALGIDTPNFKMAYESLSKR